MPRSLLRPGAVLGFGHIAVDEIKEAVAGSDINVASPVAFEYASLPLRSSGYGVPPRLLLSPSLSF